MLDVKEITELIETDPTRRYSSFEVCRIVGVTYRQLDYWVRSDLITHRGLTDLGSGNPRNWDRAALADAVLVARLLAAGLSHEAIRDHGVYDLAKSLAGELVDLLELARSLEAAATA